MKNIKIIAIIIAVIIMAATLISCGNNSEGTTNDEVSVDTEINKETTKVVDTETEAKETMPVVIHRLVQRETIVNSALIVDAYYRNLNASTKQIVKEVTGSSESTLNRMCVTIKENNSYGYDISIRTITEYLDEEYEIASRRLDYARIQEILNLRIAEQNFNFAEVETQTSSSTNNTKAEPSADDFGNYIPITGVSISGGVAETTPQEPYETSNHHTIIPLD